MGGWGSGKQDGRPIVEHCKVIDLARMFRRGSLCEGCTGAGTLSWSCGDNPAGSIGYRYDLTDPEDASLTLTYRQQRRGEEWQDRRQVIHLTRTRPSFGGRRWWMLCPVKGHRVGMLYLPNGGDIFAGRKAWRLGYKSQRVTDRDMLFERLFALQAKLGSPQGWEAGLRRPKGMWHRTFDAHFEHYLELDAQCTVAMMGALLRLG